MTFECLSFVDVKIVILFVVKLCSLLYEGWNFNSGNYFFTFIHSVFCLTTGPKPPSIPKMKEPLRGIHFKTVPEILQAVDQSIRTINTTGAARGILRLPHAGNGLYTTLVTTVKDSKTSKLMSILYQL